MMNRNSKLNAVAWLLMALALMSCNLATMLSSGDADTPTPEAGAPVVETTLQPAQGDPVAPPTISAESAPTDAPSGKPVVVYIKDGDLWRWQDGQKQRLTQQGMVFDPRLSRDGRLAVFRRPADDFHHELWVVSVADPQTGGERRLLDIATLDRIGGSVRDASAVAINPYTYEWVGNTHLLAFNTHQVFNGPGLVMLDDLYIADADSLSVQEIYPPGSGGEFVISPDGSRLALIRPDQILSANLDGSGQQLLLKFQAVTTYSEYRYYPTPQWSSDSAYLRVGIPPSDPLAEPVQPATLWKLSLEDGASQQEGAVVTVPFFAQSPYNRPVLYSLDLKRIVYMRDIGAPEDNRRELVLATYDGQGEVVVARGSLMESFGWSPDGRRVAFTQGDLQELWIGGLDAAPKPAAGAQFGISGLRWVDAKRFLAMQQQGQAYSLLLVNLNGKVTEIDGFAATPTDYDFTLTD